MEEETDVVLPEFAAVGRTLHAQGFLATKQWFVATVLAHRTRHPRIVVRYDADLQGDTSALAVPTPRTAYLTSAQLREL